jgi:hypothetical protein
MGEVEDAKRRVAVLEFLTEVFVQDMVLDAQLNGVHQLVVAADYAESMEVDYDAQKKDVKLVRNLEDYV